MAQGALDYAVGYMKERRTFGRPLADNQGLQWMVADAAMRIEAARGLVYRACAIADEGDPHGELSMAGAMAKCFASDVAMRVTTDAVQFLGGYGYTRDYPVERLYRDNRLNPIHEGTNGIQAGDLLGRKVMMQGGAAFKLLMARIAATVAEAAAEPALAEFMTALEAARERVTRTTMALAAAGARGEADRMLANAWVYLELLGGLVIGWMWLRQLLCIARIASPSESDIGYFEGKRQAARYYYRWELPKLARHSALLESLDDTLLASNAAQL